MHINLEKPATEGVIKIIADDLAVIQSMLEELYRSNAEQFSNQAILSDFEAIYVVLSQFRLASNKVSRSIDEVVVNGLEEAVSLGFQYSSLLKQLKSKYQEFIINDKLFDDLEPISSSVEYYARIMSAFNYLDRGVNRGSPESSFKDYCKGMILLSEAVEYGINLDASFILPFDRELLQQLRNIAMNYLISLDEAPASSEVFPASQNNIAQVIELVVCKHAAQSLLWKIDIFEKDISDLNSTTLSEGEEMELVKEGNQALLEALAIRWRRIESGANAEDNV